MERAVLIADVEKMTDRIMIDLYKRKIKEAKLDPEELRGTWSEARDILEAHFGKLSRVMDRNEFKLQSLYLTAIKELRRI